MCGFAADFNVLIDCKVRSDSGLEQRYGVAVFKSVSGANTIIPHSSLLTPHLI